MSLLDDILAWSTTGLSLWQRDALRRLFQKEVLDQQAMLKSAHGVPDPENRDPDPLAQKHLPAQTANAAPVILRAMRDLKHVNRIPNGHVGYMRAKQSREFGPVGNYEKQWIGRSC
ncbi:MAG: hypothetical protein JRK53_28545 [Deltaproteobacteria bacterium]|nr:hypothetical protein [Deltaproteobacteria bacterium]